MLLLPCGAGKTIIAIGVMELHSQETLIIRSSTVAVKQWIAGILDKTNIDESMIGEYSSNSKEIKLITVTTYQILCYRKEKGGDVFPHMNLFMDQDLKSNYCSANARSRYRITAENPKNMIL